MLQSGYIYKKLLEVEKKRISGKCFDVISKDLKDLPLHSRLRESQIIQAILMTHHHIGVHEPGSQPMCPLCQESELKTVTTESN